MNLAHSEIESSLIRARAGVGASDLHGSITGYLCGGGTAEPGDLRRILQLDVEEEGAMQRVMDEQLREVYRHCRAALDDAQLAFEPLLPLSDRPLPERADALVAWCRGFLGGFGLATAQRGQELSVDGTEILHDFGTIAASELACDDTEEDERSLVEVSEFVRIGALVLHAEVAGGDPTGGTGATGGGH